TLPELRGEHEARVSADQLDPVLGKVGFQRLVERSINLDGVEKLREISSFMKSFRPPRRIYVTGPVRIRPAGRADAQRVRRSAQILLGSVALPRRSELACLRGSFSFSLRHRSSCRDGLLRPSTLAIRDLRREQSSGKGREVSTVLAHRNMATTQP